MAYPVPTNEAQRQEALDAYGVLDSVPEEQFDRITRLVQRHLDVSICLVSLIDANRQWFKSRQGLDVRETNRDLAFCTYAIMADELLVVPDACDDARFSANPLVTGEPHIRFYMGAPLITPSGYRIGTLCAIDRNPRHDVAEKDRQLLRDMAAVIVDELELRLERRREQKSLEEQKAQLNRHEAMNRQRRYQFLAMLGHEFRTPLNGILTAARLIAPEAPPARNQDMLDAISRSALRLEQTIQAMLTFVELQREEITLSETTLELAEFIETIIDGVNPEAIDRNVQIQIAGQSASILADPMQLGEALTQLILNAIRHGKRGGQVSVEIAPAQGGDIAIAVKDDGPGIAPEVLDQALTAFEQLDQGYNRKSDGLGLGLPLAQKLAALHGGGLSVTPRNGGGAQAVITVPKWRVLGENAEARRAAS